MGECFRKETIPPPVCGTLGTLPELTFSCGGTVPDQRSHAGLSAAANSTVVARSRPLGQNNCSIFPKIGKDFFYHRHSKLAQTWQKPENKRSRLEHGQLASFQRPLSYTVDTNLEY